jgi:hypothetical protein
MDAVRRRVALIIGKNSADPIDISVVFRDHRDFVPQYTVIKPLGRGSVSKVIVRRHLIEAKSTEKPLLISVVPPYHRQPTPLIASSPANHGSRTTATDFCKKNRPIASKSIAGIDVRCGRKYGDLGRQMSAKGVTRPVNYWWRRRQPRWSGR